MEKPISVRSKDSKGNEVVVTRFPDGATQVANVIPDAIIAQDVSFTDGSRVLETNNESKTRYKMIKVTATNAKGEKVTKLAQLWENSFNALPESYTKGSEIELHALPVLNEETGKKETFYKVALPVIPRDNFDDTLEEFGFSSEEVDVDALFAE